MSDITSGSKKSISTFAQTQIQIYSQINYVTVADNRCRSNRFLKNCSWISYYQHQYLPRRFSTKPTFFEAPCISLAQWHLSPGMKERIKELFVTWLCPTRIFCSEPSRPFLSHESVQPKQRCLAYLSVNALTMHLSLMFYNHPVPSPSKETVAEILFSHPNVFVYLQRLPLERTETSSISRGGESGRHYSNQCLNIGQILMHNHTPRTNIENIDVEQTSHTNKNRNRHKNRTV